MKSRKSGHFDKKWPLFFIFSSYSKLCPLE